MNEAWEEEQMSNLGCESVSDLIAEVERLRMVIELIGNNMAYDPWMHTLIKEAIGYEKWQAKEMNKDD